MAERTKPSTSSKTHAAVVAIATSAELMSGDMQRAARYVTSVTGPLLKADRVSVWLSDGNGGLECVDLFERKPQTHTAGMHLDSRRYPSYFEAHTSGRAVDVSDARNDPRTRELWDDYLGPLDIRSLLDAPIRCSGRVVGVLCHEQVGRKRLWKREEISFAAEAADQLAHALTVSGLRKTEEALRENGQRYKDFVARSNEGICRFDFDPPIPLDLPEDEVAELAYQGRLAECNDAMARIWGFERAAELLGKRLEDVRDRRIPENRAADLAVVRAGFQVSDEPMIVVDRHGNKRYRLGTIQGIVKDRRLYHMWAIRRDVTDLRAAEDAERESRQKFLNLVNTIDGIVWIGDPKTFRFSFISDQAERLLGYPVSKWIQESGTWLAHIHPDDRDRVRKSWTEMMPLAPAKELEYRMIAADGRVIWLRDIITVETSNGEITSMQGVMVDITESKRMEENLRALMARHVQVREEERARISREIHDELGQQLTVMKYDLAALRKKAAAGESADLAAQFDTLSSHVDTAIVTVRRMSTQLRPSVLDHFGLAAAIEYQANDFQKRTGIQCVCEALDETRVQPALATTVFRIFQEALTNVARHAGARRVTVRLKRSEDALRLSVHDDGRGVTQQQLSTSRSLGVLGMVERARNAGGELSISGKPGQGTLVAADFPLSVREEAVG